MSELEQNHDIKVFSANKLSKLNDYEFDCNDKDTFAEYSIAAGFGVAEKLANDSNYLLQEHDNVEMAFRNIAVIGDRIEYDNDIYNTPDEYRVNINNLKIQSAALLTVCGIEADNTDGLHLLQSAIYKAKLPSEASGLVSLLLQKSSVVFADIVSNPNIKIEDHLLRYLALNTKATLQGLKHDSLE